MVCSVSQYTLHKKIGQTLSFSARLVSQFMTHLFIQFLPRARAKRRTAAAGWLDDRQSVRYRGLNLNCCRGGFQRRENEMRRRWPYLNHFALFAWHEWRTLAHEISASRSWLPSHWNVGGRNERWDMLGWKLRSSLTQPNTLSQLKDRVKTTWNEMLQDDVADLIDSIQRRVHAMIDARGGWTTSYWPVSTRTNHVSS